LRRIRPIYLTNSPTTEHKPQLIFGGCIRVYELPYDRIANLPQDSPSRIFKNASEARTFFRSDVLRTSQVTQPISAQLWLYKRIRRFHLQAFSAYRDAIGQSFCVNRPPCPMTPVTCSRSMRSPWALTPHFSSPSAAPDVRWYMNLRRIWPIYLANSPTTRT